MEKECRDIFVIGISGSGLELLDPTEDWPNRLSLVSTVAHDSAAVLVHEGQVIFGIEEERLNRVKHSNRLPIKSLQLCLEHYAQQRSPSSELHVAYYSAPQAETSRQSTVQSILQYASALNASLPESAVHLIGHHFCHAASAFLPSPFDDALIITLDGQGDGLCGTIGVGTGSSIQVHREIPWPQRSLGYFYTQVTTQLGFGPHSEYKVMGLAPYGDPARFRNDFKRFYELLPRGDWHLHLAELDSMLYEQFGAPRPRTQPLSQIHMDIAAALQESLEQIILHVASFYRTELQQRYLCLAGGIALNCTANSRLLRAGLFDDVFVQPAAHDGGGALGAALAAEAALTSRRGHRPMQHVYWGVEIKPAEIPAELNRWGALLGYEACTDIFGRAAELIDDGNVLGWVNGRSEFGPRALGNRSIVADPRRATHKDLINAMVKKREAFRPFAPAVTEEDAADFFAIKPGTQFPFMIFVAEVMADRRDCLGAITHVDGSARVQTVSRATNPRFWQLLSAFKKRTGVPILLNTSFNNNAEPVIDSVRDAIVCFITTGLNYLVIGDYLIRKKALVPRILGDLQLAVPAYTVINETTQYDSRGILTTYLGAWSRFEPTRVVRVGKAVASMLRGASEARRVSDCIDCPVEQVFDELVALWEERLIVLQPT